MVKLFNLLKEVVSNKHSIFSDMDGVLFDFDKQFSKVSGGIIPRDYEKQYGIEAFWKLVDSEGVDFWANMEWMPEGKQLWEYIKKFNPSILSAPSKSDSSKIGKQICVDKHMPGTKLIFASRQDKKNYASPTHILIDDREDNINSWVEAGGIGVVYLSTAQTVDELKKLGF